MAKQAVQEGTDNFEISPVLGFSGYVSSIDPTIASAKVLVQGSQNVYFKTSGTIANRFGRKRYDAGDDTTIAKVNAGYIWNTSLGATLPVRCANSKLQFESNVSGSRVWYDLVTALTKTRFVFDTYWDDTDKKDKLLAVNGSASLVYEWAGGIAKFVSATPTVITLDRDAATAGFASSGSVIINGNTYTYTGISGSTLTGASDASAEAANSVVYSKIILRVGFTSGPGSTYTCDFIRVVSNQLYLGSYSSQLVYMSKNTSYYDFSFSTPRLTGEGDTLLMDSIAKGIGVSDNAAHIFYGSSHLAKITFSQIAIGSTLSEQVEIAKVALGNNVAAMAHEFIDSLSDNIIYLDQANQVRSFGNFRNVFVTKAVLLSQAVQDELAHEDFTLGQLRVITDRRGDMVYLTSLTSGKTYIYTERNLLDSMGNITSTRQWQPPQVWGITGVDSIAGSTIGFSNANPQFYYLWDTGQYYDDSPSGQLPYRSVALMSYQNGGRRQGKIHFDKIYWEGYMTSNSNVYGAAYIDYQGSTTILNPVINANDSQLISGKQLFSGIVPPSLGDASLGDNPLGDGINALQSDDFLVPKFRVITGVQLKECFEYALMIYSENAGARWELLALGTNATEAFAQGVELIK